MLDDDKLIHVSELIKIKLEVLYEFKKRYEEEEHETMLNITKGQILALESLLKEIKDIL